MLIYSRYGIMLGLFLFLLSCGGKNGGDNGAIARIEITPSQANVSPGQPVPFSAVAKTSSGNSVANVTFTWQSTDPSIATVDADGIATGVTVGVTSIVAVAGTARGSAPLGVVSPARGASNLTLSGTAQYEDKLFNKTGFTDKVPMPIRGAIINLIAIDGFANLDSRTTGEDGTFNFSGIDNSSRRGGLYLQVLSKTDSNHPTQVEIRNNTTDKALYALVSSALDDSAATSFPNRSLLASATSGIGGAFNSLDVFSKANELIRSAGPCSTVSVPPSNSPCLPPLLTAYWEPGSSEGTFYDDQQDAIFILGGGTADGDTDEYDDSVIAHEYGHFIVAHFSHDNSPGGTHTITDNAQDIRLSFSEGWGNFFSSAVRNSPLYVDTFAQGVFSYELEGLTSPQISALSSIAVYDTHELSNSKVLWDIFDAPSGDDDPLQLNFTPIWQTMIQIPAASPATMESFWLTFAALNPSSSNTFASGLQTILQGRKIELFPDANAPSPLTPNAPPPLQHHTLYRNGPDPTGDEDVIPLNNLVQGTPYTVETLNLTNGADTFLFITDASDHPISGLQNDNRNGVNDSTCAAAQGGSSCPPNDKLTLSSSISFNAPSTGTFHAHVKHSPAAPLSAGLFGSYDIQLKSP